MKNNKNKIRKYIKTVLCAALSIALLFIDVPVAVFAAEGTPETGITTETAQTPGTQEKSPAVERETAELDTENAVTEEIRAEEHPTEEEVPETTEETAESTPEETEPETEETSDGSELPNEDEPESPDGEVETEEPEVTDEEGTAETEEPDSVSENDLDEQGEVRALAASGDVIDSGTYENITWAVDVNGKLTVEGTGDFADPSSKGTRAPWRKKFNTYYAIKSAEIKVTGMTNASGMFDGCSNLAEITFKDSDTSTVTNMSDMFNGCKKLERIDWGQNFNTGNVTDMSRMFSGCNALKGVDLSGFDTSNVTSMSNMFAHCRSLEDVNLSSWNTGKVTNMSGMFYNAAFHRITLGGSFTTHNVTNMMCMFACNHALDGVNRDWRNLKGLDLGWLDLSSVENMTAIFGYRNVKQMDFSRLNTGVTTTLTGLFLGCDLTGMDFSGLLTDTITDMSNMFAGCTGDIDLHTLNTDHVTDMSGMFSGGGGYVGEYTVGGGFLTRLDLSGLNTENVTNMSLMFSGQSELTALNVSELDTANVTNMAAMFSNCANLTSLDLSSLDCGNVVNMDTMFSGCSKLSELNLGNLGTGNLVMLNDLGESYSPLYETFGACSSLKTLDLSRFDCVNLTKTATHFLWMDDSLVTIYTPYNVTYDQPLPTGDWYMADGTKLENNCLPKNLPYSVLIQKGSKPTVSAARMEVSKRKTAYSCGETLNTDDLSVTYYGADGSVRRLTAKQGEADGYTTNESDINMTEPGEKKLIVTYQTDDKSLTAEITLTVTYGLTAESTTITLSEDSYTYDGKAKTPKLTVAYSGSGQAPVQLTEGTDYIVSYSNNINAYEQSGTGTGTSGSAPTVIITGMGDYSGTVTKTFAIGKAAAPAAEEKKVMASRCTQADPNRTADLSGSFASCGKKTGYEVLSVEDPKEIFTKTPVTADIQNGVLKYGTDAAQENDTASIRIKVSFANYEDAELTVKIIMSEEGVVYTVDFDLMGHGSSFAKSGIKAGSLLTLSADELTPAAEGYLFTGWYRDKSFAAKSAWNFDTDTVQSDLTLYACWLTAASADGGLQLCVQEIPDLTYTGSAQKPAVTVYDSDGKTLLKAGKDYTVKYINNTNAVKIGTDGKPEQGGGTAKVENPGKENEKITDVIKEEPFNKELPYVVITGKGNYTETIYRNFHILPAGIAAQAAGAAGTADNTPLAAGFTLKYTDQFEAKAGKTAKIISSFKYKKALKEGSDYEISVLQKDTNGTGTPVALAQGKLPLNAGNYELVITGTGNYTGTVRRSLYVADKKNLMKNASVTYTKTIQAQGAEDLKKGIEQSNVTVKISGKTVDAANYTIDYAGTNHAVGTATMTITGTNGYVGSKSVTFKITGRAFSAKTVEVKTDDGSIQDGSGWKAAMTYTGRSLTQNRVTLTTKVDRANPTARELTYGEDYTITYKNNVKKGTAAMTFTAKPESGFSGSFKKNFKINAQELSADMFVEKLSDGNFGTGKRALTILGEDKKKHNVTVKWDEDAVHSAGGASLDFQLKNAEGMELKQGTDYTISYKDNKAATKETPNSAVKAGSKQPVMTIKGKGSYAGTLTVQFQIIPASIDSAQLTVTAAQVQKKSGMQFKDFKLKVADGKTVLKAGRDYTIDESGCTQEIIQAYADSFDRQDMAGTDTLKVPKAVIKGMGNYGMQGESASDITREISLADYIYGTKLTSKNLKVEVTGSTTYTGRNVEPTVKVSYYIDNNAASQDGIGVELTNGTDYKVTYGSKNIPAGKKKGSITITGAGIYGGSVTVKFDIDKKAIY